MTKPSKQNREIDPHTPAHPHPKNQNLMLVIAYRRSDGKLIENEEQALADQAEIDGYDANRGFLPWEYCECGCHGHELVISKDCYFWCFQPEPIGKSFVLRTGHCSLGTHLGTFKTWREVDEAIVPILKSWAETKTKESQDIMAKIAEREASMARD